MVLYFTIASFSELARNPNLTAMLGVPNSHQARSLARHGLYDVIDARYHTSFLLAIVLQLRILPTGEKPQPCNAWASRWDHPTSQQAGPLTHAVT